MEESGMTACLSTAYLPPVQWFAKLLRYDKVYVEQYENYQKQTYRNRCVIAGPNGAISLTVPIEKPDTLKCLTKDIRISDHGNWRHLHWNALESAYNQTPYFEYLKDDLRPFYEKSFRYLMDFNEELIAVICALIDIEPHIERTTDYIAMREDADFRDSIHPKKNWQEDKEFNPVPYYQVFQQKYGFLPNLSIVDLLFNMGPESVLVLSTAAP
ncbi:MAG: WbqC family protein [Bacteroidaceae bacterium]|nr:WbqC family protein [Bacteroidaceae bacterium]MBQ9883622.1 WbqC family protein [Bacteroidaceae bacterium]